MAESRGGEPLSFVLLEGDRRKISSLDRDPVKSLEFLQGLVRLAGVDGEGRSRLPFTEGLVDDHLALLTSVGAARAKLVAETVRFETWRPMASGAEWDTEHRLYARPNGPSTEEGQERGLRGAE